MSALSRRRLLNLAECGEPPTCFASPSTRLTQPLYTRLEQGLAV